MEVSLWSFGQKLLQLELDNDCQSQQIEFYNQRKYINPDTLSQVITRFPPTWQAPNALYQDLSVVLSEIRQFSILIKQNIIQHDNDSIIGATSSETQFVGVKQQQHETSKVMELPQRKERGFWIIANCFESGSYTLLDQRGFILHQINKNAGKTISQAGTQKMEQKQDKKIVYLQQIIVQKNRNRIPIINTDEKNRVDLKIFDQLKTDATVILNASRMAQQLKTLRKEQHVFGPRNYILLTFGHHYQIAEQSKYFLVRQEVAELVTKFEAYQSRRSNLRTLISQISNKILQSSQMFTTNSQDLMLSSSSIALLFNNLVLRDIFEPTLKDLYSVCIALQSSITKQKNTIRERKVRTYKQTSHHYPSVLKFKKRCRYCSYRKTILICSGCSTAAGKEVPICVCCFEKFHEEQRHLNIRNKEFIKEWKEQAQIGKVRRQKLSELNKKTICRKKLVKKGTLQQINQQKTQRSP